MASLPPVLLPEKPTARDVDAVRFGLGLRGYRMDQVDEVLDRLAAALAEKDAVIAGLRAESAVPGSR
ncbi:DivIVA domain-containing protein [Arthrobacter agilis]|uniref:DivIVA domain-containing protein n=1 Tax=Arthrobacter agilis TaxID=37921 RepID=UPI00361DB4D4